MQLNSKTRFSCESIAMRVAKFLGLRRIRWSLRRLYVPVNSTALVLEVGSGGNPYPRSNILVDAYEETRERHWEPLIHDRLTVLAFGENLPFKDKSFDFVIAAHVLEHTQDPEKFLAELQRVAHAGYIETPDAFMERINPYKDHRLEVTLRNNCLVIRKKPSWIYDAELVELYEHRAKRCVTRRLIPEHPFDFHCRYYWQDKISFRVVNPETDASWQPVITTDKSDKSSQQTSSIKQTIRHILLKMVRWMFLQNGRNRKINVYDLLMCPNCASIQLHNKGSTVICNNCNSFYPIYNGIPRLYPKNVSGFNKVDNKR